MKAETGLCLRSQAFQEQWETHQFQNDDLQQNYEVRQYFDKIQTQVVGKQC